MCAGDQRGLVSYISSQALAMRGRGLPRDFGVMPARALDSLQHSPSAWPGALKEDFLQEVLLKLRLESGCSFPAGKGDKQRGLARTLFHRVQRVIAVFSS